MKREPAWPLRHYAYRESIWDNSGSWAEQYVTAAHADALLRRAQIHGAQLSVDVAGSVTITRHLSARTRTIRLRPVTRPTRLTDTQAKDLELLRASRTPCLAARTSGLVYLYTGLHAIPPAPAWRLIDAGWISLGHVRDPGTAAPVSCAGALALAHRALRQGSTPPTLGAGERHWLEALLSALLAHLCSSPAPKG